MFRPSFTYGIDYGEQVSEYFENFVLNNPELPNLFEDTYASIDRKIE